MAEQPIPRQRFRSSCTNCAAAKVKCSTTRPNCARCSEGGLTCFYAPSNRYGRRPAWMTSDPYCLARETSPTMPVESPMNSALYHQLLSQHNFNNWIPQVNSSCRCLTRGLPFSNLLPPQPNILPVSSTLDWAMSGLDRVSNMEPREINSTAIETASALPNRPLIGSISGDQSDPSDSSEVSHSCIAQAAQILVDARTDHKTGERIREIGSTRGGTLLEERCRDAELIMGDVIFTNRKIIDQVTRIMGCDCAVADCQILVVISLIWFHLIDKYSEATTVSTEVVTTGLISRQTRDRITGSVQVLLGELRGLSSLVETLLARSTEGRAAAPGHGAVGVSVSVFRQLQGDLTRHLRQLYLKVEQLQQDLV